MDEATARARLFAQGDGALRKAAAHRVLDNCCGIDELHRQVDELVVELERLAARSESPSPRRP